MRAHKQLWEPWIWGAFPYIKSVRMAVEASDVSWAEGVQVHSWRDLLKVSSAVQASDRR